MTKRKAAAEAAPVSNLQASVYALIEELVASEGITKRALGAVSREILLYVPNSKDIECVNRLVSILSPMNRRVAILYFAHFLPWDMEKDASGNFSRFGKMHEGTKKVTRKLALITEWLGDDEANNIWSWSDANIEVKQKDFAALVANAIKKALKGDEKTDTDALTPLQVMDAVFAGGIGLEAVLAATEAMREAEEEHNASEGDAEGDVTDTIEDVADAA